ncbi:hypothetical protein LEL_00431 [Akanthomyces lecanii RCEF 1005]|uniref:Uncharacterized protein n=1 Tax=Akanthomyces lecanii RCEF 1005 TaxID=1081108 RepID=A0A162KLM2_CORDF|nr:hypothetical protein LEL_00431 [Akanthomyces lecanii RCEF 1005]
MRAFTKAAALLLVHSVAGESMPGPVRRVSATETIPTAYITLNVPVDGTETQLVPLRLDLAEGEEPCSPAQVRVNGQPLAQDADGFGQGILTLDHDITITSNWTFACQSLKQALTVNVHSVNGNPAVDPTFFIAHFYQTTPVQIATVENVADVRYLHLHTTVTESLADSGEEHADVTNGEASEYYDEYPVPAPVLGEGSGGVNEEVAQLKELRRQARELVAMIRDQEDAIMDKLEYSVQEKLAAEPAPTPLGECRDVRCAFKALVYRFRHSHEEVCESGSGWRALFGCAPEEQLYDEEYDAEMDWSPEDMEDYDEEMDFVDDMEWLDITNEDWDSEEAFYTNYEEDMLAMYYESARKRMLMLVAETAVIVGAAVFCITSLIRRLTTGRGRCLRPRTSNELPLYQGARYFDEPKTLLSFDDKSTATASGYPDDEKAILLAAEQQAAKKTSVAEEISELRRAASVVSDLVAVEAAERRSSVDYDDEAPPAYEHGNEREHSL